MSGIFGVFQRDGQPASRENLTSMGQALAAFGPDGGGVWLSGPAGLGQRLMLSTPQDRLERQPLVSAEGSLTLVSDGRIDNRPELLADLRLTESAAPQLADGELILRAYQQWGQGCLSRLVGVFAFAIWDASARRLFAARSPIMAPSLVYYVSSGVFAFATMPGGLHALPFVPRVLNEARLASYLTFTHHEPQDTLYQGVLKLQTGHWLAVDAASLKTGCYWQPDLSRTLRFSGDGECLEAFKGLLERVVADALHSATPCGMLLSGGLDSATVAAQAASLLTRRGERLVTFTEAPRAGFDGALPKGRYADETGLVAALARRHPNLETNVVRTPGGFFMDNLEQTFACLEEPFRNTSNRVWIEAILREASQGGLRTVLDGAQGNLTVSWNGSGLLPELLSAGHWRQAWRQAGTSFRSRSSALLGQGLLPLLPAPAWLAYKWLRRPRIASTPSWLANSILSPDFAAELHLVEQTSEQDFALRFRSKADKSQVRYEALVFQDSGAYLSAYQALFGVNMRSPLADVRLAEFCLALPESQYLWNGQPRRLVRRAMAGLLPDEVLANRRRGLQAADWFERLHAARPQVADELARLQRSPLARRMLNLQKMKRMFEAMPAQTEPGFEKIADYRFVFERGLMMGRFLTWFEEGV